MEPVSILMPGGLRLRSVRPLADRDGSYPLLYDFERSHLIAVPDQFRFYVDSALETGDLDGDLLAWLANEDVLTYERDPGGGRGEWAGIESWPTPEDARWGRAGAGFAVGQVLFFRDRVHGRLGLDCEATTLADLSALLRQTGGASALTLELGGEEPVRRFEVVRRVAEEAERHERLTSREVTFQLTVDPAAVTPAIAAFLADRRFQIRVALGGGSAITAEPPHAGLALLLDRAPERVTVHAPLAAGERLADLWRWAKAAGVHRFDANKVYDVPVTDLPRHEAEVRAFRGDLFALCDEMYTALEHGSSLPLYEPIARIVRRLIAGRPLTAGAGCEDGYLGLVSNGEVLPCCGGPYRFSSAPDGPDAAGPLLGCDVCWGPCQCDRDASDVAAVGGDRLPPCEFRRAEIEVAMLFFGRLRDADATCLLGFPADRPGVHLDPLPGPSFLQLKTC